MMIVKVKDIPPNPFIITLDEGKKHLDIGASYTDKDADIETCVKAASNHIVDLTGRYIIEQTLLCICDSWGEACGPLPYGEFQEVVSLTYLDPDGERKTVSGEDYHVLGVGTDEGRIRFKDTFTFPALFDAEPVTLEILIGYKKDGEDYTKNIPPQLTVACKFALNELYSDVDLSARIESLCMNYRDWRKK